MNNKGFTLVEVIVALAVLAVGIVALLGAHRIALAHSNAVWEKNAAVELAESKLKEAAAINEIKVSSGQEKIEGRIYRWSLASKPVEEGLAEWSVSVNWREKNKIQLTTWSRINEGETN